MQQSQLQSSSSQLQLQSQSQSKSVVINISPQQISSAITTPRRRVSVTIIPQKQNRWKQLVDEMNNKSQIS
jgi:hypothetical protein